MRKTSLAELFLLFLRIGAFTFGGGMAMVPVIRRELVDARGLVTDEEFLECIALTQCSPGPIAGNLSVLLGYRVAGWAGAAVSIAGVAIPAFVVILVIAWQYAAWREQAWAAKLFAGLRPAILVLIAHAAFRFSRMSLRTWPTWIIFGLSLAGLILFRLHPVVIILGAAAFAVLDWRFGWSGNQQAIGVSDSGGDSGPVD